MTKCPVCKGKLHIPEKTTTDSKRPTASYTFVVCPACKQKYKIVKSHD